MLCNFLELCQHRYSCRSYLSKPVEKEKVEFILKCARLAPSAVNKQPWRIRIVEGKKLEQLWMAYPRDWFRTAPMALVVTTVPDEAWVRSSDGKNHADVDGSIITEHICLAAAAQGLGSCWICNFIANICRTVLSIPADEVPLAIVPIGYPADEAKMKTRKLMSEIIVK